MPFTKKQHQQFIEEMKEHVALTMRQNFNGKIDDLKRTTLTKEDFEAYVKSDVAWKEASQPAIDNMKNLTGVWKTIISMALGLAAVSAGFAALKKLFGI